MIKTILLGAYGIFATIAIIWFIGFWAYHLIKDIVDIIDEYKRK